MQTLPTGVAALNLTSGNHHVCVFSCVPYFIDEHGHGKKKRLI